MKLIIILLFLIIVGALTSGLFFLIRDPSDSNRTVKSLTWRIALSFLLMGLVLLGILTGVIQPHGIGQ